MPEFVATHTPAIADLDQFTRDYLEAVEWTDCNADMQSAKGFSAEAIEQAKEDCEDFRISNEDDLALYSELTGYTGGVDFWLTRNRHGAGFWDRGNDPVFRQLTDAARAYGGRDTYPGCDSLIHFG